MSSLSSVATKAALASWILGSVAFPVVATGTRDCQSHPLLDLSCCSFTAPSSFNVSWVTTKGNFSTHSERAWGPIGVDRLYSLFKCHFFDSASEADNNAAFFRTVSGFVTQFGIPGNPAVSAVWENAIIENDPYPLGLSNTRGWMSYAAEQDPNTGAACNRTEQVFINYGNNSRLDAMGFTPVAVVTTEEGMAVVDSFYSGYGDNNGPDQDTLYAQGDSYLKADFPLLDYVISTTLIE
jgi:peptidyl-prolyl cis-trans isomerase A (cyclophilin A)